MMGYFIFSTLGAPKEMPISEEEALLKEQN
jgi:hypothetical protein